jgi:KDO2-lipid IV(A) lauroyltransferase
MSSIGRLYKRSRLRRFIRRRKDAVTYHLARCALWPPRAVSLPRALAIADRVGDVIYRALPDARRLALEHLAIAFGDTVSVAAREQIARASYRNAARCFVEVAKFDEIRLHFDEYASIEGWEHWEEVRALDRGGIVITGHIGNWELLGAYCASKGIPIAASVRRVSDSRLDQLLNDFRTSSGLRIVQRSRPGSGSELLKVLKQRRILALLIDQDVASPSLSVPFFGRLARTPVAAAALAVRRDLPVVPAFARRRPEGGHHFTIMAPIYPPNTGDRRRDVVDLTRRFSRILEDRIRENPAEWVWWHRRWRRRPVPRLDLDTEIQYSNPVLP